MEKEVRPRGFLPIMLGKKRGGEKRVKVGRLRKENRQRKFLHLQTRKMGLSTLDLGSALEDGGGGYEKSMWREYRRGLRL